MRLSNPESFNISCACKAPIRTCWPPTSPAIKLKQIQAGAMQHQVPVKLHEKLKQ